MIGFLVNMEWNGFFFCVGILPDNIPTHGCMGGQG